MFPRPLPIFSALLLLTPACADVGSFRFTEESQPITVAGHTDLTNGLPLVDLFPAQIPFEINLEQELEEQDASGARAVYLTELYFELTDESTGENFDFLDELRLSVAPRDSSSSLLTQQIAVSDPVPQSQNRFHLEVQDDVDLKPYVEEGLRLRTNASGSAPADDVVFKVYATFRVQIL